jgi:hypothetical protein
MLNAVGRYRRREAYEPEVGGGYSRSAQFAPCQPPERAEADNDGSEWRSFKQLSTFAR